jgi:hypothetical protein
MKRFPNCEKIKKDKKIVLSENKSELVFQNPERLEICILQVDGCAIQEGLRCDYALSVENLEEEFYIELKGSDIQHAFKQIESTIQSISSDSQKKAKVCFVIATRCPISSPEIQAVRKRMRTKFNAELIVKKTPHTHPITPS